MASGADSAASSGAAPPDEKGGAPAPNFPTKKPKRAVLEKMWASFCKAGAGAATTGSLAELCGLRIDKTVKKTLNKYGKNYFCGNLDVYVYILGLMSGLSDLDL